MLPNDLPLPLEHSPHPTETHRRSDPDRAGDCGSSRANPGRKTDAGPFPGNSAALAGAASVDRALIIRRSVGDIGTLSSIAFNRFDYSVDFTRNSRSAVLSFLSHAQKRIVSFRVKKRAPLRGHAYNEFVHHRMRDMHTIDYNLSLLEPLGVSPERAPSLSLNVPESATREAVTVLEHARIRAPFALVHPGSARAEKFWEPKRWGEVIRTYRQSTPRRRHHRRDIAHRTVAPRRNHGRTSTAERELADRAGSGPIGQNGFADARRCHRARAHRPYG